MYRVLGNSGMWEPNLGKASVRKQKFWLQVTERGNMTTITKQALCTDIYPYTTSFNSPISWIMLFPNFR